MKSIRKMDMKLRSPLKKKQKVNEVEIDDDDSMNELDEIFSMPLPSLTGKNYFLPSTSNHEFLRLNAMVRAAYFSYLHKCLLNNYIVCYEQMKKKTSVSDLKKCAYEMEMSAVRSSLETSLYRKYMNKMFSDIKSHTSKKKIYNHLMMFLETPTDKVDVGVQTSTNRLYLNNDLCNQHNINATIETCVTPNYEELFNVEETLNMDKKAPLYVEESSTSMSEDITSVKTLILNEEDKDEQILDEQSQETIIIEQTLSTDNSTVTQQTELIQDIHENSPDLVMQHMENMFSESDDSNDLTKLIEKHSSTNTASVDKEIGKTCSENDNNLLTADFNKRKKEEEKEKSNNIPMVNVEMSTSASASTSGCSKELDNRAEKPIQINEKAMIECKHKMCENKQKKKGEGVWLVERIHQVSKLKAKMAELSMQNYRRYGKIKKKYVKLFGECGDEDMMPDSPISIEEHLNACKDRIAPWIVKYLMPFYKKRQIKDRELFKALAKHIADILILHNTFPEESSVNKYIDNYFENKKIVSTIKDIYF